MKNIVSAIRNFLSPNSLNRTTQVKESEDIWIATYGTLKKDYNNYNIYLTNSTYLGSGITQDKYPLIIKDMPYLIEELGQGYQVEVDVFKITQTVLAKLDEFEVHPTWYRRKQIPIQLNGTTHSCWLYFSMTEAVGDHALHKSYKQVDGKTYLEESSAASSSEVPVYSVEKE